MPRITPARKSQGAKRIVGLVAASVALLGLSACSSSSDNSSNPVPNPSSGTTEPASTTRVYESQFGPVEIPVDIERIVSVDFYTPAALLDIGVTPVGVVNSYFTDTEGDGIPLAYTDAIRAAGTESIGEYYEMSLEAIVKADPDVVIATSDFLPLDAPLRAEIEKVAPIITFEARDGEAWRTRATELAKILGKEAELEPLVAEYNERRDAIKAEYGDILTGNAFTVFVPFADEWGTYADTHFSTPILRDLGATFREQQADEINEAKFPNWFSFENLDRLSNADVIFVVSNDPEAVSGLSSNAIWNNLPAVQNGLVFDYIPLSPTGSFGWALENLADLENRLEQVREKIDAQG